MNSTIVHDSSNQLVQSPVKIQAIEPKKSSWSFSSFVKNVTAYFTGEQTTSTTISPTSPAYLLSQCQVWDVNGISWVILLNYIKKTEKRVSQRCKVKTVIFFKLLFYI